MASGLAAAVVCVLAVIVAAALVAGFRPAVVVSGSMRPALDPGDLIWFGRIPVHRGDVVAFRSEDGRVVTHRVVGFERDGYRVKGDANAVSDSDLVPARAVLGVVRVRLAKVGRVVWSVQSKAGRAGLIWMTAVVAWAWTLRRIWGGLGGSATAPEGS